MIVDAHLHVWDPTRAPYPWLTPELAPLNRTILLDSFAPPAPASEVRGVVLVQAADNAADTAVMREQAAHDTRVVGIVAWAPLDQPEQAATLAAEYQTDPLIVGVRNLIHERQPGWLAGAAQADSLDLLAAAGLTLDFVTATPHALTEIPALAMRHPDLRIVIDHLGKPPIGGGASEHAHWRSLLADASAPANVCAKLSGLVGPGVNHGLSTVELVRPFVEDALDLFGADRLMFGSDWPLVERAEGYAHAYEAISSIARRRGSFDDADVFSQTALRFYGLQERRQ